MKQDKNQALNQEPLNRLTIMVTDDCNLSCRGCVTNAQDGKQGKRTIDPNFVGSLLENRAESIADPKTGMLYMFFSGRGEPTLRMDIIEEIYSKATGILGRENLYVGIQTNGVFGEETLQKISEISDLVWVSVDGAPKQNDEIRKYGSKLRTQGKKGRSSEYITQNVRRLLEAGIDVRLRSTIHQSNLVFQKELVDYATSLGIKTIVAEPAIRSPSLTGTGDIYLIGLNEFVEMFIEANNHAASQGVVYTTGLMEEAQKAFGNGKGRCRECFCIKPEDELPRSMTLTTDNRLSGCYLGYEDNLKMRSLTFGKWEKGEIVIDKSRLSELIRSYKEQGCHGRSLIGDSEISQELLRKLFDYAVFPDNMPRHS